MADARRNASRVSLSADAVAAIREAVGDAGRRDRPGIAKRLAAQLGVSAATIYRAADLGGRSRKRAARHPEYRDWVRIAVRIAHEAPKRMALEDAIASGVLAGSLPPEARQMPLASAHRVARELGLSVRRKRRHRISADYPMQALLSDGSTSEVLTVAEDLGGGDWLLAIHRNPWPASGYKNKPLGPDRMRVVTYAIWDMCTGYARFSYTVARGENAIDHAEALCTMLSPTGDPARPLHGVPDDLWLDQGPLFKSAATRNLLRELDIAAIRGEAYAKERMGGVERQWRSLWHRFERTLFLRDEPTIRLSELRQRLEHFEAAQMATWMSRTPVAGRPATRAAAWIALTNARPADNRLRRLPDDPIRTVVQEVHRTVDDCGIFGWGSVQYEVQGLHGQRVLCKRALDGTDRVIAIDATGVAHTAHRWTPRPYGEIRSAPKTPLEHLLDEDAPAAADPWAAAPAAGNVLAMPVRTDPPAPLVDPLAAADRCRDLDEAVALFVDTAGLAVWTQMSEATRERVRERIGDDGLDRSAVVDLALQISAAACGEAQ